MSICLFSRKKIINQIKKWKNILQHANFVENSKKIILGLFLKDKTKEAFLYYVVNLK